MVNIDFNFEGLEAFLNKNKKKIFGEDENGDTLNSVYEQYLDAYYELIDILSASGASKISDGVDIKGEKLRQEIEKSLLNQGSIINDLKKVTQNEFDNNSILELKKRIGEDNTEIISRLDNYVEKYDKFFNKFNDAVDFFEQAGSIFRNEKTLHQFLLQTNDSLREVFLNEEVMRQLRRDRSMFKIGVTAAKNDQKQFIKYTEGKYEGRIKRNISLKTREDMFYADVMQSFDNAYMLANKEKEGSGIYIQHDVSNDAILSQLQSLGLKNQKGNKLGLGRLNEIRQAAILYGDSSYLDQYSPGDIVPLDTLAWIYGGDQTYMVNGERYYLSQKSITFRHRKRDNQDLSGIGFSFSRWNTILEAGKSVEDGGFTQQLIDNAQSPQFIQYIEDNPYEVFQSLPNGSQLLDSAMQDIYGVLGAAT